MPMTPQNQTWLLVGALKLVAVTTFCLVYWKKLSPTFLIAIPIFYIGVALYALKSHVPSAAALCGIILAMMVVVYFVPGPARELFMRALGR